MSRHQLKLTKDEKPIHFLFENSLFLILGTVIALVWANASDMSLRTYQYFFHEFQLREMIFGEPEFVEGLHYESGLGGYPSLHDEHADSEPADSESHEPTGAAGDDAENDLQAEGATNGHATDAENSAETPESEEEPDGAKKKRRMTIFKYPLTWHFIVNDILMMFFFAIAAKEVWESLLPGGALSRPSMAAMPLLATFGGIAGPAFVYVAGAYLFGGNNFGELSRGWAIPCATDIAFSYLVARLIFGASHPVIAFLLLLAIADDAAGLAIIAIFYPTDDVVEWSWLLMSVGGMVLAWMMRRFRVHSFWWYLLIPGTMSWLGFYWAHVHPALGLVPIIPMMPHALTDLGTFAIEELDRDDTLSEFEHWWKNPVELILGLFGLANAGVAFSTVNVATWLILAGLLIGKPLGITLLTFVGDKFLGLSLPNGIQYRHVFTLSIIASIGFTVALFVSTAAYEPTSPWLGSMKMGAVLSFVGAILAYVVARVMKIQPMQQKPAVAEEGTT
ncbi:MAG: Na+/H+ antiporter NhaA [Pirellulaceae bacterium]